MNGYTGVFTKRLSVAAGTAYLYPSPRYEILVTSQDEGPGGTSYTPFYASSLLQSTLGGLANQAPCRIRIDIDALQNDCNLKVKFYHAVNGTYTLLSTVRDATSEIVVGSGGSWYFDMPSTNDPGPQVSGYCYIYADVHTDSGTGRAEVIVRARPYAFPGWEQATVAAATSLTAIDPGITNTALGRASLYSSELGEAKDMIAARIRDAGIDPDMLATDGVTGYTATGAPQAWGPYVIPELVDAASLLTLGLIYERMAQAPDDMNAFRAGRYMQRYEDAWAMAAKSLPVNIDRDFRMDPVEENQGISPVLVR